MTNRVEAFTIAEGFDNIVTRAYASLMEFISTTQHLLNKGGQLLAMKGLYPESELKDIIEKFDAISIHKLTVPFLNAERHLICIIKRDNQSEAK